MAIIADDVFFNRRCTIHQNNRTLYITLPKELLKIVNLKPGEEIEILIHRHITGGKVIELCHAKV